MYCPSCFRKFQSTDKRSLFTSNKIQCGKCKRWIDYDDRINKECTNIVSNNGKFFKPKKMPEPKFMPSVLMSKVIKHDDIVHYCKPDFYKGEMKRPLGSEIQFVK